MGLCSDSFHTMIVLLQRKQTLEHVSWVVERDWEFVHSWSAIGVDTTLYQIPPLLCCLLPVRCDDHCIVATIISHQNSLTPKKAQQLLLLYFHPLKILIMAEVHCHSRHDVIELQKFYAKYSGNLSDVLQSLSIYCNAPLNSNHFLALYSPGSFHLLSVQTGRFLVVELSNLLWWISTVSKHITCQSVSVYFQIKPLYGFT